MSLIRENGMNKNKSMHANWDLISDGTDIFGVKASYYTEFCSKRI